MMRVRDHTSAPVRGAQTCAPPAVRARASGAVSCALRHARCRWRVAIALRERGCRGARGAASDGPLPTPSRAHERAASGPRAYGDLRIALLWGGRLAMTRVAACGRPACDMYTSGGLGCATRGVHHACLYHCSTFTLVLIGLAPARSGNYFALPRASTQYPDVHSWMWRMHACT